MASTTSVGGGFRYQRAAPSWIVQGVYRLWQIAGDRPFCPVTKHFRVFRVNYEVAISGLISRPSDISAIFHPLEYGPKTVLSSKPDSRNSWIVLVAGLWWSVSVCFGFIIVCFQVLKFSACRFKITSPLAVQRFSIYRFHAMDKRDISRSDRPSIVSQRGGFRIVPR